MHYKTQFRKKLKKKKKKKGHSIKTKVTKTK